MDLKQNGVLADLGSSSCTGRVVQDQWVLVCDVTIKGAGRERGESTSQLQPAGTAGGKCLQLSEQWGREVGNCLYTTLRVAIAAPWSFNLHWLWPRWAGKGWGCSSWTVQCPCLAPGHHQHCWIWGLTRNCHADMPFLSRGKCLGLRYPGF